MSLYFAKFPTIKYSIEGSNAKTKRVITNPLVRLKFLDKLKNNVYTYYPIVITDEDTMEILAYKYYGNSEYHWIIALANDIVDTQYDWPLKHRDFMSYLEDKYGSIEDSKTTIHHYEKVITRTHSYTNTVATDIYTLQETDYNDMEEYSFFTFDLADNTSIVEEIRTRIVYSFEYENEKNEEKRNKKIIKKDYLDQILSDFNMLMRK